MPESGRLLPNASVALRKKWGGRVSLRFIPVVEHPADAGRMVARERSNLAVAGLLNDPNVLNTRRTSGGGEDVIDAWSMELSRS